MTLSEREWVFSRYTGPLQACWS